MKRQMHKKEANKKGQKGCAGLFRRVSVCSSCGQWITQKFKRISVSLNQPFLCLAAVENCKLTSGNISVVACERTGIHLLADRVQPEEDRHTEQQSAAWDLAAIMLFYPSCSQCSCNPPLHPLNSQSYTWRGLTLSNNTCTHTFCVHTSKLLLNLAKGGVDQH